MQIEYFFAILYVIFPFLLSKNQKNFSSYDSSLDSKNILIISTLLLLNIFLSITETIILLSKSPQIEKTIVFSDFLLISLVGFLALAEEFIRTKYLKKGKLMLILSMFIWIFSHKIIYSDGNFIKLLFLFLSGTIFTISTIYFHKIKLNYLLHILYNLTPFLVIVIL